MKITLDSDLQFRLAQHFAEQVHDRVIERHIELTGSPRYEHCRAIIRKMRGTLRSIEDPYERRDFVQSIGWHFRRLREEKGTDIRIRDYVARVYAFRQTERLAA